MPVVMHCATAPSKYLSASKNGLQITTTNKKPFKTQKCVSIILNAIAKVWKATTTMSNVTNTTNKRKYEENEKKIQNQTQSVCDWIQ